MNRLDFLRLIGAQNRDQNAEYIPVACLMTTGYGVAGYFNDSVNEGLSDAIVLANARLVDLHPDADSGSGKAMVRDFNEFLEDIVMSHYNSGEKASIPEADIYGKSIPLVSLDTDKIAVVYPVAHISHLMKTMEEDKREIPTFLDFDNKSVIIKILRTKLW